MKLSENIRSRQEEAFPAEVAECHVNRLHNWQVAAERLERDQRDAWRSFYFACTAVGLLVSFAVWQRFEYHPQCGAEQQIRAPDVIRQPAHAVEI